MIIFKLSNDDDLGMYTAHGHHTCQGFPGSFGHEEQDAKLFASWNVEFLKNDWCAIQEPIPDNLATFNKVYFFLTHNTCTHACNIYGDKLLNIYT